MMKRHYIPITVEVPGVKLGQRAFIRKVIRTALAAEGMNLPCEVDVSITDDAGKEYTALGLANFTSVQSKKRFVEDVYGTTDLYPEAVVGFVNKSSTISGVETPLLTAVQLGYGNEGLKTPEGFRYKNVIGSHLTGPILVKNPRLLDKVVSAIYEKRGEALPAERPTDRWTEDGYAITAEALKQRI